MRDADTGRRADLAAIHIGKKALGWSDDEYRDILWTVCSVRSSALLDFAGRKRFLAHLKQCGWAPSAAAPPRARKAWTERHKLAWSLWQQLADAGLIADRSRRGLDAWVKRQTQVDSFNWLNAHQLDGLISSLKRWATRREAA